MDQNVVGSIGWWKCSLHGHQGLVPANRLLVLSPSQAKALYPQTPSQADKSCSTLGSPLRQPRQGIYQVPSVPRPCSASPAYECMERIYEVPSSAPRLACWSPGTSPLRHEGKGSPSKVSLLVNTLSYISAILHKGLRCIVLWSNLCVLSCLCTYEKVSVSVPFGIFDICLVLWSQTSQHCGQLH